MSNSKIHIDQLFAKGLENLEIPIVSKDFETIRKELSSKQENEKPGEKQTFEDFELAVTDADWQILKDRLAKEKRRSIIPIPAGYAQESFKDFEIAVTDADWQATKLKLNNTNKKKIVWWWWLNMAIIGSLIGLAAYYFIPSKQSTLAPLSAIVTKGKAQTNDASDKTLSQNEKTEDNLKIEEDKPNKDHSSNPLKIEKTAYNETTRTNKTSNKKNNGGEKINISSKSNYPFSDKAKEPSIVLNAENKEQTINEKMVSPNPFNKITESKHLNTDEIEGKVIDTSVISSAENKNQFNTAAVPTDTSKKAQQVSNSVTKLPLSKSGLLFYFGITTEIARTYRHLSSDNSSTYNTIRNNAEKPLTQFSYGLTVGIQKAKNQFQSGFQITEQNFVSNYNYTLKYRDSIPVYDPNGKLIGKFPIGPIKEKSVNESNQITIRKMDIPFMYHRFWKLNTKTQLLTGLGGVLGINIKEEGTKMLNPANDQLYSYNYLKGSEQSFEFSPNINIGIQRKLNSHLELQCNTFFKYSVTNRYDKDFSAKEYPYSQDESSFSAKEYLYSYGLSIKILYLLH